jgi:hypothetical protein
MQVLMQPGNSWLLLMGRLAPGTTRAQAQAEMAPIFDCPSPPSAPIAMRPLRDFSEGL